MIKRLHLKIFPGLTAVAILAGVYSLKNENAAAQSKKQTAVAQSKSLCQPNEQMIWTCATTRNKLASVCASKDLAGAKSYVQYRFGLPEKVELEFPKDRQDSVQRFKYSRYTRPLVTMLTLSFESNGIVYEIHDDDNSEEKPPVRAASIDVADGDKKASFVCRLPVKGSLMKLEDIVPRDEEN